MPLPTTGLKAHFKASVGVTESSGRVSAWADQSGNGFDMAQSAGGNQPLLVADGNFWNGTIPVIRFTESRADTMFRNTTPTNIAPPYCYAAVCRILANSTFNWMWGGNDSFRCIGMSSSNQYVMFNGNVVGLTAAGASPLNTTYGLLVGNFDGASSHLFWNGRDSGAVDSGNGTSGNEGLRVGGGGSGAGDTGEFDIAELFYWDHALDAGELDDLHEYVVDTYGPLFTARFRADMEVTDVGAGVVSAWGDMGPSGFDLAQATGGERPTLVDDVVNGQPIIRFTRAGGSNLERATTPALTVPFSWAAYFTGLVAHSAGQWFLTADGSYRGVLFNSSEQAAGFAGDTDVIDSTAIDGNPHSVVLNIIGGTNTSSGYIDGVAGDGNPLTVNSGGGATLAGIRIGDPTSGDEISIDAAEFALFDHELSAYEIAWIQDYFVDRYETSGDAVLASDGVATAAFTGNPLFDGVVAPAGVATAAFTGTALSDATLAAAGVGAAPFVGAHSNDSVWASVGEGAAAFIGAANAGVLVSDGIGAASFVGALTVAVTWVAAGSAIVHWTDEENGVFTIEGIATVEWVSLPLGGSYWYEDTAVDNTWTPEAGI